MISVTAEDVVYRIKKTIPLDPNNERSHIDALSDSDALSIIQELIDSLKEESCTPTP